MINSFEKALNHVNTNSKAGVCYYALSAVLSLSSFILQMSGAFRSLLMRAGIYTVGKTRKASVISIGSPFVGGTNKTPLADLLVKELSKTAKVALLSRGYRSKAEQLKTPLILSEGKGPNFSAAFAGDEAFLLSEHNPSMIAIVGKNRLEAAKMSENMGAQAIILDDGMQYGRLHKDFQVIAIDAPSLFKKKRETPLRLKRSSLSSLSTANLLVITETTSDEERKQALAKVSPYSLAAIAFTQTSTQEAFSFKSNEVRLLRGAKVAVFCGIARPERFLQDLENAGAIVLATLLSPDHLAPDKKQLRQFSKLAKQKGADFLICTEKDRVKIAKNIQLDLPLYASKMELRFIEGESHWLSFVEGVREKIENSI